MEPIRVKISVAAKMLNVAPLTIRRGIYAGRVPCIRTSTDRIFIPMSWIQEQSGEALKDIDHPFDKIISTIKDFCIKRYGPKKGLKVAEKAIKALEI